MILLSAFSGLALMLACVGLYGVISYSVAHQAQEIGIRMALRAQPGALRNMVLRQGMRLALIGAAIGIAVALLACYLPARRATRINPLEAL